MMCARARLAAVASVIFFTMGGSVLEAQKSPLYTENKIKNYLPHMSWKEAEEALQKTDMVIIPVGSMEQHGKHLPLCTDIYAAVEVAKLVAQKTEVLVAPAVFAGLSKHHMGFPGSITLTPETFEAVVFETAQSLIHHGIRKVMLYNGHGGNNASVTNIIQKINQATPATAFNLGSIDVPDDPSEPAIPFDWHAGELETSLMLYLTTNLVDMSLAEKPVLTFPPIVQKVQDSGDPSLEGVMMAGLFRPKDVGKKSSSREMSNIGVFTSGDPKNATAERGRRHVERFVEAAVTFIESWKKVG